MVIMASSIVRGRMRLAMTSPQHGGHGALFFARFSRLAAATQPTASSLQQLRNGLENLSFCIIHSIFGGKIFFLQVFKHFWKDISIKLSVYFSIVKELLSYFWHYFKTTIIN